MSSETEKAKAAALESFKVLAKQISDISDSVIQTEGYVRLVRGALNTTLVRLEEQSEAWYEVLSAIYATKTIIESTAIIRGRLGSVVSGLDTARFEGTRPVLDGRAAPADDQHDTEVLH